MTISITDNQLVAFTAEVRAKTKLDYEAEEIDVAFSALVDALNEGLVLYSGDGFYYSFKRYMGNLVCQDGSKLKGSLYTQLSSCVWQRGQLVDVIQAIVERGVKSLDHPRFKPEETYLQIREELESLGLVSISLRAKVRARK